MPEQITPEGLVALRAEIERLERQGRAEIAARLRAAREVGDLKENADYHIAKEDQAHLETKIERLTARLRNAQVVDEVPRADVVCFGSTVCVVEEGSGQAQEFTLVGPTEADVSSGRLSAESPVGLALIGKRAGEMVSVATPGGERRFRVERVGG